MAIMVIGIVDEILQENDEQLFLVSLIDVVIEWNFRNVGCIQGYYQKVNTPNIKIENFSGNYYFQSNSNLFCDKETMK